MKGFSEVDDVMHNTVGCLIGWCMVKGSRLMVLRRAKRKSRLHVEGCISSPIERQLSSDRKTAFPHADIKDE